MNTRKAGTTALVVGMLLGGLSLAGPATAEPTQIVVSSAIQAAVDLAGVRAVPGPLLAASGRPQRRTREHHRNRDRALRADRRARQRGHRQRDRGGGPGPARAAGVGDRRCPGPGECAVGQCSPNPIVQEPGEPIEPLALLPGGSASSTSRLTTCASREMSSTAIRASASPWSAFHRAGPHPALLWIRHRRWVVIGNVTSGNAGIPTPRLSPLPGADVVWDGTGSTCFSVSRAARTFLHTAPLIVSGACPMTSHRASPCQRNAHLGWTRRTR